jgi:hypothetical protein
VSPLIDAVLPRWDAQELHGADVAAPPDATWAAVQAVTLRELPLTCLLMWFRSLGRTAGLDRTFLDAAEFLTPLREAGHDKVVGLIGRPWHLRPRMVRFADAEEFAAFDRPGYVRAATDLRVEPAAGGSRVTTETRILATDPAARRQFMRYWRVVGLGSALIRRDLLRAVRRRAEAAA